MIKSLIQLIPFGWDEDARVISGFYIANTGPSKSCSSNCFDYVVGYFERASKFTDYKPIVKVLFIKEWNNNQSTFALMQEIFGCPEYCWYSIDSPYLELNPTKLEQQSIEIFKQRAIKDGIYEQT